MTEPPVLLLTPESEHALDTLRRALRRAPEFGVHVVVADDRARGELFRRFRAWSGVAGIPAMEVVDAGEPSRARIDALLSATERSGAGLVVDATALLAEDARLARDLNVSRDVLPKLLGGPLVLIVSPSRAAEFQTNAPDLFDVRSGTYEVEAVPVPMAPTAREHLDEKPPADLAGLRQRAAELQALEAAGDEAPPAAALAKAWLLLAEAFQNAGEPGEGLAAVGVALRLSRRASFARGIAASLLCESGIQFELGSHERSLELARAAEEMFSTMGDGRAADAARDAIADVHEVRGNLDEALRIRRERVVAAERQGAPRERLLAQGGIARVLRTRGDLDEALRIYRDELLPAFGGLADARLRALTLGDIADVLHARGDVDEALRIRRDEELPVFERLGDVRSRAITVGRIADLLRRRGDLDEALRIYRDEVLPAFERLGDIHSRAVTLGKIADVLQARGQLDEALRIRREEELPVYERLGDVRSRAITLGRIGDVLEMCGELDEALRIRRDEELPVYERLGDVQSRAITFGKVADALQARGEIDEALRIRREEELPVYERLGDGVALAYTRRKLARALLTRAAPGDRDEALRLLRLALADAERLALPEAAEIRADLVALESRSTDEPASS